MLLNALSMSCKLHTTESLLQTVNTRRQSDDDMRVRVATQTILKDMSELAVPVRHVA